jgi:hypothetical protein
LAVAQRRREGDGERFVGGFADAEGAGDSREDERGIGEGGEIDEDRAGGVFGADGAGDGEGDAGLADAAGTGEDEKADVGLAEEGDGRRDFGLAADQRRQRCR